MTSRLSYLARLNTREWSPNTHPGINVA